MGYAKATLSMHADVDGFPLVEPSVCCLLTAGAVQGTAV